MDELTQFRKIVRDLITKYAQFRPANGDVRIEVVFDESQDHYELMYSGWSTPYPPGRRCL